MDRPSVLVLAYACSPIAGSEHGAGWGVVTALLEFSNVTVITGSRHIAEIREWEAEHPGSGAEFIEVPDRILGPMFRWHRIPEVLHYLTWLRKARKAAHRLTADKTIDASVHATFSAFWLPSPIVKLGVPAVWGPVGGAVTTPRPLRRLLGFTGLAQEILDFVSVRVMAALPPSRRTATNALEILVQNDETEEMLPEIARNRARSLNHALFSVVPSFPPVEDGRYALWVSPMESRKGPQLAIAALAKARPDIKLVMVGDGPQREHLKRAASEQDIADRVTFTGLVPRDEAIRLMRGATTVLFTGLREEGGIALAESMYAARRIIVLDHGGAGAIARSATDQQRVALIPPGDPSAVATSFARAMENHFDAEPPLDEPLLDRQAAVDALRSVVASAVGAG